MMDRWLLLGMMLTLLGACSAEEGTVDFKTLARTSSPNQYLVCPPGYCASPADAESPVFALPVERLMAVTRRALEREPRTALVHEDAATGQLVYVQRSLVLRFPDTIRIQLLPLDESRSTLAIYSRSNYGSYDFGVNRRRVQDWLGAIAADAAGG